MATALSAHAQVCRMKQVIVARTDLDLGPGKLAAQVAHAAVSAAEAADPADKRDWLDSGQQKVVLKVDDLDTLHELFEDASRRGLPAKLVKDAGRTELEPGTTTVVGIGPASADRIDAVTGHLPLY